MLSLKSRKSQNGKSHGKGGKEEMILITQIIRINIGFFIAEGTKFDQKGRKID